MPGAQPFAPPVQGQTLQQYLASLGNVGSDGPYGTSGDTAAASEYNADATTPGYAQVGNLTSGGDLTSTAGEITGPTGLNEVPVGDIKAPSPQAWWQTGIEGIIGAGLLGGAAEGALGAGAGSGVTDASLGELGINTALPAVGTGDATAATADSLAGLDAPSGAATVDSLIGAGATGTDLATGGAATSTAGLDAADAFNAANAGLNTTGLFDTNTSMLNDANELGPLGSATNPVVPPQAGTLDFSGGYPDSSIFTGDQPIDTPSPLADQTIAPASGSGMSMQQILQMAKAMGISPVSAASLLGSILAKPKVPNVPQLTDLAQATQANAAALAGTESTDLAAGQTGILPAGAQAQINQAETSAEAAIKSKYAAMGLSGSTMEQQDLIGARAAAVEAQFNEAQTLANQGVQIAGVINSGDATSAQIYETIMQAVLQQDSALQSALANFASSSALGAAIANRNTPVATT